MSQLFTSLNFNRGPAMKNRFMLAPMITCQNHVDGTLSDDEYNWLIMRAEGGFGLTMTGAATVQPNGKAFPGQLGAHSDNHIEGLAKAARGIKEHDSLAIAQLHHGGMRALPDLIDGLPFCPSDDEETGARAMSTEEVEQLIEDFVLAAERCDNAGFDGVELHGAHGYIIAQFLSPQYNHRDDQFGGSFENRCRLLFSIIDGIRARCRPNFIVGVRISPERFGMLLAEAIQVAERLMQEQKIDFLNLSLWDVFKEPEEEVFKGQSLLSHFSQLERYGVRLGVAGKIRRPEDAERVFREEVDWLMLGRAAILHHDFPRQYSSDRAFEPVKNPVKRSHLQEQGLSEPFINYMSSFPGFIE